MKTTLRSVKVIIVDEVSMVSSLNFATNERQKQHQEFSSMLDCVRRGCPTDETLSTLEKRVIQVSTSEKFVEPQKSGHGDTCLLATNQKSM